VFSGAKQKPEWLHGVFAGLLIAAAGVTAYANSLDCAFVFDDIHAVVTNPNIRSLRPWTWEVDYYNLTRPLFQFSFAVNYALGGLDTTGYHLFNITVHIFSALILFGILRLSFSSARLQKSCGVKSLWTALIISLIWVVHPLNTQAVTYICQRCESMMGLFYLLTLYAFIRGNISNSRRTLWFGLAVIACSLGMMTKEIMVTAPLMCLFYDYFFLPGSLKESIAGKKGVYLWLASTWLVLIASQPATFHGYPDTLAGNTGAYSPLVYLFTQFGVITHYLRLVFLPYGLVLDYAWPPAALSMHALSSTLLVIFLLFLTIRCTWKNHPAGFPGVWFFLILGVTSSFLPLEDAAFEHRMYLPSAAVITATSLVILKIIRRFSPAPGRSRWGLPAGLVVKYTGLLLLTALIATLAALTAMRNRDYRSELSIWEDTLRKRPENSRAWAAAAVALDNLDRTGESIAYYREALRLNPGNAMTLYNYGNALYKAGDYEESIGNYEKAIELNSSRSDYYSGLGSALKALGKYRESIEILESGLKIEPDNPRLYHSLGVVLTESGKPAEAVEMLGRALRHDPDNPGTNLQTGIALLKLKKYRESLYYLGKARELMPNSLEVNNNLGIALGMLGRVEESLKHFERALEIDPGSSAVRRNIERLKNRSSDR